jgi:hypothetical protein
MTMEQHPDAMAPPPTPSEQLEALLPGLRAEVEAVDPDVQKLSAIRAQLAADVRRLEAALEQAPAIAAQYSAGFERDLRLLADLAHARPELNPLLESALVGCRGAAQQCSEGPGQMRRLLDRVSHLSPAEVRHAVVPNLVAELRAQMRSLTTFPKAVPEMRSRLDHTLEAIRDRLTGSSAAPAMPALETLPPRPPGRPPRAQASLHDSQEV